VASMPSTTDPSIITAYAGRAPRPSWP
jgi:hypothetical protein